MKDYSDFLGSFEARERLIEAAGGLYHKHGELTAAASALIAKLDAIAPHLASAATANAMHGFLYEGPTYGEELEALRAVLETN